MNTPEGFKFTQANPALSVESRRSPAYRTIKEKKERGYNFFRDVLGQKTYPDVSVFMVSHIVPHEVDNWIRAINDTTPIKGILPKPTSLNQKELARLKEQGYNVFDWSRDDVQKLTDVGPTLQEMAGNAGRGLILLDHGGYFAPVINDISALLGEKLLGVVEATQNGALRYKEVESLPCPVISVAKSPLKASEDHQTGHSIVFSAELLSREVRQTLQLQNILTIGFGPIGKSIAEAARDRKANVFVYDKVPTTRIEARSMMYDVPPTLEEGIANADLIFSATGGKALTRELFPLLKRGARIALATSGDDEIDVEGLKQDYNLVDVGTQGIIRCESKESDHHFYLLNGLKTLNFMREAQFHTVGPFIFAVQAEVVKSTQMIAEGGLPNNLMGIPREEIERIAEKWEEYYG